VDIANLARPRLVGRGRIINRGKGTVDRQCYFSTPVEKDAEAGVPTSDILRSEARSETLQGKATPCVKGKGRFSAGRTKKPPQSGNERGSPLFSLTAVSGRAGTQQKRRPMRSRRQTVYCIIEGQSTDSVFKANPCCGPHRAKVVANPDVPWRHGEEKRRFSYRPTTRHCRGRLQDVTREGFLTERSCWWGLNKVVHYVPHGAVRPRQSDSIGKIRQNVMDVHRLHITLRPTEKNETGESLSACATPGDRPHGREEPSERSVGKRSQGGSFHANGHLSSTDRSPVNPQPSRSCNGPIKRLTTREPGPGGFQQRSRGGKGLSRSARGEHGRVGEQFQWP